MLPRAARLWARIDIVLPRLILTRRFGDERGWFHESYNAERFAQAGIEDLFVQDNHSFSAHRGTVRGLHFQTPPYAQAKLVRCTRGAIWDVAVDLRGGSPTYGRWVAWTITAAGGEQIYLPAGFAHGFVTLTDDVEVMYKVSAGYAPAAEGAVRWDDPDLAITWPLNGHSPILSDKDAAAPNLAALATHFAFDGAPLERLDEITL